MTLKVWIDSLGQKEVCKLLQVAPSTVSYWRNQVQLPRPTLMVKIHKITKGKVTYAGMIEPVAKNNNTVRQPY